MTEWVAYKIKASQLNDKRLHRQLTVILESPSENPKESIPAACQGWTETHAAYRFLDNDNVNLKEILFAHKSCRYRIVQEIRASQALFEIGLYF
jgi:hypothetical protein